MTFQLSSALFGGSADKYLPMPAINCMCIVLPCENHLSAFVLNGLQNYSTADTKYLDNAIGSIHIVHPAFYVNMVQVDPTSYLQLIASAKSEDGAIQIYSQSYSNFHIAILVDTLIGNTAFL